MEVSSYTAATAYARTINNILVFGEDVMSRIGPTKEIRNFTVTVTNPIFSWAAGTGRNANKNIAVAEGLMLVAGEAYPNLMDDLTRGRFKQYKNGEVLHGAYGPRVRTQLVDVVERLAFDPGTRQAVCTIWDPQYDNDTRADLPCTVMFQFMIRHNKLEMFTTMRSNDAWNGLPYDLFQFMTLQKAVGNALGYPAGNYHHHVASMHLYEEHWDLAKKINSPEYSFEMSSENQWPTVGGYDWFDTRRHAKELLDGFVRQDDRYSEVVSKWKTLRSS